MASLDSFRLIDAQDSALTSSEKIKIVEAASGDTAETLAARMGFLPQWLDQFLILNGLERDAALIPGRRYKVVAR
jgi:predicted Zn-dependent protease